MCVLLLGLAIILILVAVVGAADPSTINESIGSLPSFESMNGFMVPLFSPSIQHMLAELECNFTPGRHDSVADSANPVARSIEDPEAYSQDGMKTSNPQQAVAFVGTHFDAAQEDAVCPEVAANVQINTQDDIHNPFETAFAAYDPQVEGSRQVQYEAPYLAPLLTSGTLLEAIRPATDPPFAGTFIPRETPEQNWIKQEPSAELQIPMRVQSTSRSEPGLRRPGSFACPDRDCTRSFPTKSALQHHRRCHIPMQDRPHACTLCPFKFNHPRELVRHLASHGVSAGPRFYCPHAECFYATQGFNRKDNLDRHVRNRHRQDS